MSDEKKTEAKATKIEDRVAALEKSSAGLWSKIGSIVKVMEKFWNIDIDRDGKVGRASIAWLCAVVVLASAAIGLSATKWAIDNDAHSANLAVLDDSGNMTITGTMTAGAFSGSATDMTGDDINANGSQTDTLGINFPAMNGTNNVIWFHKRIADAAELFWKVQGTNDLGESVNWFTQKIVFDDNTTNTEDVTYTISLPVAGVDTTRFTVKAAGVDLSGAIGISAGALANDTILEGDLKAVDSASDEDFLSYESTTGDFEWHSAAEIQGKFTEGSYADSTIVAADIKDGEVKTAEILDGTVTLADVNVAGLTGSADGAATAAAGSATYFVGSVHRSVFTFTNVLETFTDGSDEGESQAIFTFPEGRILILGAAINCTVTNGATFEASANDVYFLGIGSAAAGDDATLSGTEQDIIAATTVDTTGGTITTYEWEADMTAGADSVLDGSGSAAVLYLNTCVADTSISGATPVSIRAGTLSVVWVYLGDD